MRATAAAILLFIVNLVGAGLGPFIVGFLNYMFAPQYGQEAIRYSLLTVAMTGVVGAVLLWLSSRHLEADLARARD